MRCLTNIRNLSVFPLWLENQKSEQLLVAKDFRNRKIQPLRYKGDKIMISDPNDEYHDESEYEIRYLLRRTFYNKCVYCEKEEYKPDVEHFRPKQRVKDKAGNKHGYYWLCYNWSNLLPSCRDCNQLSGKREAFPVAAHRATGPPFLANGVQYMTKIIHHAKC